MSSIQQIQMNPSAMLVPRDFVDSFCGTLAFRRRSLMLLYGVFLELTRQFYSDAGNYIVEGIKGVWTPDPLTSKIWIDTEYIWEDNTPNVRPAIYISLGGLKKQGHVRQQSKIGVDVKEGLALYSRNNTGTVNFVHIGQSKGETVNLTSNTADYFEGLQDIIRDDFCFETFHITDVTPLKVYKESADHLRGEVVAQFTYNDFWSIKTESPKLKKIVLSTRQSLSSLV